MEFHIRFQGTRPDPATIEDAVRASDPSAVADVDPLHATLRVATSLDAAALAAAISQAGHPLSTDEVVQVPSTCCGGCSS